MKMKLYPVILIMGVSGCGKTTIGKLLAEHLGGFFVDADDLHPEANRDKMSHGIPLNDEDRWPWLGVVSSVVQQHTGLRPLVLACSALKKSYRDRLSLGKSQIIHLCGARDIIEYRLSARQDHFMPSRLLDSQIDDLEEPEEAIIISVDNTPGNIVDQISRQLIKI